MLVSQVCEPSGLAQAVETVCLRLSLSECHFYDQQQQNVASASVCSIGSEAYRSWRGNKSGHVIAVFRRSCYVQCSEGVICIGKASLGKGPLHVLLSSDQDELFSNVTSGQWVIFEKASWLPDETRAVDDVRSSLAMYSTLYTGDVVVNASFQWSERYSEILSECAGMSIAENGFGWLLDAGLWQSEREFPELSIDGLNSVDGGLRCHVFPVLQILYRWLVDSLKFPVSDSSGLSNDQSPSHDVPFRANNNASLSDVHKLLGAGPGLTPAGDDLLAGVMLALHRIYRADLADAVWDALEPSLTRRTNVISGAHLRVAARGQCSETMLQVLEHLTDANLPGTPDSIQCIARDIKTLADTMGATSGWDTLAGMGLFVRAMPDSGGAR